MSNLKSIIKSVLPEKAMLHLQAMDHWLEGEPELRLVPRLCQPHQLAIDVGANIGTYAYHLRRHGARVVAYEPNPDLAQRLSRLMPDVDVRNLALSDQIGEVVLQIPVSNDGTEQHELASIAQHFDGPIREHRVRCVTLDSEHHPDVGFIKIDVEQHERAVLRGAMTTIRRCRPIVMTEATPLKYQVGLAETFRFLLREAYVAWFRFGKAWHRLESVDPARHLDPAAFGQRDGFMGNNLIFAPEESALARAGPT